LRLVYQNLKKTGLAGTGGVLPEKSGVFSLDFVLVLFIGTDPSNIDTVISNLRKSMGEFCRELNP